MSKNILNILKNWLQKNPTVFQFRIDGSTLTLKEVISQKQISFDIRTIKEHRIQDHPQGLGTYINLIFDDGKEIILCHAGIAFSPSFVNTGPIPDTPPVICIEDYQRMLEQLKTLIKDLNRKKETLAVFNFMISILDGAKEIGLDVNYEVEDLEKRLSHFEKSFLSKS